ncbi:short transient receptor potential channel 3 [Strongylocentrotus purpuratus]|uniref:Transient receptor ion channel domain-containing protein n=1 Tax=Strongylocentrotus purpuratus TaxID=7668 RepID=A0A7M7RBA1_STRPU|nr:short transient receptor potential channel 3 [Strongylocentrotus purpuratus]
MPKAKQPRDRHLTFNASHELAEEDRSFLRVVSLGNFAKVREIMENSSDPKKLMQLTDFKDCTALEIATEAEHFEIVEYLVQEFGDLMDEIHLHECLMLAISKGYLRITQVILNHPLSDVKLKGTCGRQDRFHFYLTKNNSKFDRDLTPLMLAAQCNEAEIIRLLLDRGEYIQEPHAIFCSCKDCTEAKENDPLLRSLAGLHTYQALGSEAYICLTSHDPILTAFLLSEKLTELASIEKEFKNEYRELVKRCKQFASDLLDMCQTTAEVQTILKQEATTQGEVFAAEGANTLRKRRGAKPILPENDSDFSLPRLELAIKFRQKQFVAHPHCQHHLSTLWYKGFPSKTRQWHPLIKCLATVCMIAAIPFLTLAYWICPNKVGDFMRSPRTKFMLHAAMYVTFLLILFLESVVSKGFRNDDHQDEFIKSHMNCTYLSQAVRNQTFHEDTAPRLRPDCFSPLQILIVVFVMGMLWAEIKQIFREGYKIYLQSLWNWIDIAMLNILISSISIRAIVVYKVTNSMAYFDENVDACEDENGQATKHLRWLLADRTLWDQYDPTLIAEALYAIANVLSFSRLLYILPVNEFLGPLNISLQKMVGQILRFFSVFIVVFLAFFCALTNLYRNYPQESNFRGYVNAIQTLIWALFGLSDAADVSYPSDAPCDQESCGQKTTELVGVCLYMAYHLVMALVMLNMLIAMMSTSFQEIHDDEDVEWKFARSQLWMSYFERGATLPLPMNIIPSPKSIYYFFKWLKKTLCPNCGKKNITMTQDLQQLPRRPGIRKQVSTHESLMKTVIKRYLFKLQNDKEGEEGAEGELEEIKNDISSFRFEVMERMKHLDPHGGGGGGSPNVTFSPTSAPVFQERNRTDSTASNKQDIMFRKMYMLENRVEKMMDSLANFFAQTNEALRSDVMADETVYKSLRRQSDEGTKVDSCKTH